MRKWPQCVERGFVPGIAEFQWHICNPIVISVLTIRSWPTCQKTDCQLQNGAFITTGRRLERGARYLRLTQSYRYHLWWRHHNMSQCTGSQVNGNYERNAPLGGAQFLNQDIWISETSLATHSGCQRANHSFVICPSTNDRYQLTTQVHRYNHNCIMHLNNINELPILLRLHIECFRLWFHKTHQSQIWSTYNKTQNILGVEEAM